MANGDSPPNDATAQTLNYALGNLGGRQKSWMQAANPSAHLTPAELTAEPLPFTVRKRGRPRKITPRQLPPAETARPTIEPQAEPLPPSNSTSTSPQLANVVTRQHNANHTTSVVTVFPSPTPSEEMQSAPVPALPSGHGTASLDFLDLSAGQAAYAPETPLETVFMDEARRVGRGSQRPSGSGSAGAEAPKRVRQERPAAQAGATQAPQTTFVQSTYSDFPRRPSIPQRQISSPQLRQVQSRSPSLGQVHNGNMPSPQLWQGTQTHNTAMTPPHAQATFGAAGAVSGGTDMSLYSFPAELQPTWYTRGECLQVLNKFQANFAISPEHQRDGRRISVLRDAADKQDWQYLILHQYYCLLDFNPAAMSVELRSLPGLQQALKILQDVLDNNQKLSPVVLYFFSNFPYSLEQISAKWPAGLHKETQKFASFVGHAPRYEPLKLICERRRFPPVAWELARYLSLESTTFQRLLFTANLRSIWRANPWSARTSHYETRAVDIFEQTQASYGQRLAEHGGHQSLELGQVSEDNKADLQHWGTLLKQLVAEYETVMRGQGQAVATPGAARSQHVQQTPQALPQTANPPTQQARRRGRPRRQPVVPSNIVPSQARLQPQQQQQLQPQVQQYQPQLQPHTSGQNRQQQPHGRGQQPRQPVPLLPPPGWNQPQQRIPDPARFSLHQAHLRSPILKARVVPESPLYHFMQDFITPPARLLIAHKAVEKWSFTFNADMARCIPAVVLNASGGADCATVDTQSKTVRIRCIKWPAASALPNEHVWATRDTSWIPYSYFSFNGTSLQQRKKVHHGKDLPIDVTRLVKEGENTLEMTVMAQSTDTFYEGFLVAIEYLGVISQVSLRRRLLEECRIPAQQVLADIQSKLNGSSEDDEIAIVESNLSITLFDPFSTSKICDTPVRSRACLHNNCFDLDTFLHTRRRKGDASVSDHWRCPICNADARPQYLVVDGFLEEVKKVLDAQGRSNTRAIVVHQDGSWKPKAEVRDPNGVSDYERGSSQPPTPVVASASVLSRACVPVDAEVIDLSD